MFTDLVLRATGLTDNTRTHSKDIISKPQFVINFQRDINLLLYSDIVDKCLGKNKETMWLGTTYEDFVQK